MTEHILVNACKQPNTPTLTDVLQQLNDFKSGFAYADIISPAALGDGILDCAKDDGTFDSVKDKYKIVKFVPASGAATRMFKDLFQFLDTGVMNATTQTVLDNVDKFAFWDELKDFLPAAPTPRDVIECIVGTRGLNYGNLPKGLLRFHKYPNGARSAMAEHLVEGAKYAASNGGVNIHFTVSPEHITGFQQELLTIMPWIREKTGMAYNIDFSVQKPETNTIAVNLDNTPFVTSDGAVLFRPSGHGALIENLNDIDADIIFVKNIDNVCPENQATDTVVNKKMLASIGLRLQQKIFEYIRALDNGVADLDAVRDFIRKNLGYRPSEDTDLRAILNRPLRVCGMVVNTGAPGGGPFWVRRADGVESLQIVEASQIAPEKKDVLAQGQFFNPVDLVCLVRDVVGNKFNLTEFVDATTGFISEKSYNGRPLRAMERPGLWNGAMANWNTVFVVVPATTFTPAKVVTDLIKPEHQ